MDHDDLYITVNNIMPSTACKYFVSRDEPNNQPQTRCITYLEYCIACVNVELFVEIFAMDINETRNCR